MKSPAVCKTPSVRAAGDSMRVESTTGIGDNARGVRVRPRVSGCGDPDLEFVRSVSGESDLVPGTGDDGLELVRVAMGALSTLFERAGVPTLPGVFGPAGPVDCERGRDDPGVFTVDAFATPLGVLGIGTSTYGTGVLDRIILDVRTGVLG